MTSEVPLLNSDEDLLKTFPDLEIKTEEQAIVALNRLHQFVGKLPPVEDMIQHRQSLRNPGETRIPMILLCNTLDFLSTHQQNKASCV